jgi:hypothetical protein
MGRPSVCRDRSPALQYEHPCCSAEIPRCAGKTCSDHALWPMACRHPRRKGAPQACGQRRRLRQQFASGNRCGRPAPPWGWITRRRPAGQRSKNSTGKHAGATAPKRTLDRSVPTAASACCLSRCGDRSSGCWGRAGRTAHRRGDEPTCVSRRTLLTQRSEPGLIAGRAPFPITRVGREVSSG